VHAGRRQRHPVVHGRHPVPGAAEPLSLAVRSRIAVVVFALAAAGLIQWPAAAQTIRGSPTYRPEVVGRVGVVAAGRHFAAEAGLRMLARGGNAIDAGVAATFAAAVSEISHFGLGGEAPIIVYLADRKETVVINGQGVAPAAAVPARFPLPAGIPANGPSAGTVPAVVDALAIGLARYGTLTLGDVLAPAIELADGFVWYEFLTDTLKIHLAAMQASPSGARVYLQGPGGTIPPAGSVFRQPELAATLRALVEEERRHAGRGRGAAIEAARDRFYRGDIGARIARAVQQAGGLLTADDLARYRGRTEAPLRRTFTTRHGRFEVLKAGFWSQGPMLLQALAILEPLDLERLGHNSPEYIHTVTEALKLALADRDEHYGDPDFARVPGAVLLSDAYAAARRASIDPGAARNLPTPGDPSRFERGARAPRPRPVTATASSVARERTASPDTTCVDVVDARGNLFSAAPSSGWFFGGTFIAGDTGVPLGNRMQAFVLDPTSPNVVAPGKRPRTTLSPTVVLRDGKPWLALSSPGGDSQDQQALQVFLNLAVFGMTPQSAIEAPRFNSLQYQETFGGHRLVMAGGLEVEDRIPADVRAELQLLGHKVVPLGAFMMDTGTVIAGFDADHGTVFGAADVRRQRFVTGW
jgi:gamma-glutamyltranspeptidase/glutathione hydrolase